MTFEVLLDNRFEFMQQRGLYISHGYLHPSSAARSGHRVRRHLRPGTVTYGTVAYSTVGSIPTRVNRRSDHASLGRLGGKLCSPLLFQSHTGGDGSSAKPPLLDTPDRSAEVHTLGQRQVV